jgi:hypothetical protein
MEPEPVLLPPEPDADDDFRPFGLLRRQRGLGLSIYVWPVPSTDITLELDYSRAAETVTDPSETVDIPEDWQEAVVMGLAGRCASMFGITRIDPGTVQRIDAKASSLYQRLLDRDRPDSYYFEPDA